MLSADQIQNDDQRNTFHSLCFLHWLKLGLSTKLCYLNQYIPHYRMMNISSGRLLLQMNNLTVLYQSGLGVQWYPGPSAFKLNQSLWSSLKHHITPPEKVWDLVQRLFSLKMPGSQFKLLTVEVLSPPISHDIHRTLCNCQKPFYLL